MSSISGRTNALVEYLQELQKSTTVEWYQSSLRQQATACDKRLYVSTNGYERQQAARLSGLSGAIRSTRKNKQGLFRSVFGWRQVEVVGIHFVRVKMLIPRRMQWQQSCIRAVGSNASSRFFDVSDNRNAFKRVHF